MTLYSIVLFLHVVGALGFFGGLAIEWLELRQMRRATSHEQLREWLQALGSLGRLVGPSLLILLVTGMYMAATVWPYPWVGVALVVLFLFPILGIALGGRRMRRMVKELGTATGPVGSALDARVHDPIFIVSWRLRTALALGIVYLMTTKPVIGHALIAVAVAAVVGIIWSLPLLAGRGRAQATVVTER
ncbi:MAG: hypothetical protein GEV06_02030 [Luteitalea sp.]|nr:hypothetical protein [Luteitalea sp.]